MSKIPNIFFFFLLTLSWCESRAGNFYGGAIEFARTSDKTYMVTVKAYNSSGANLNLSDTGFVNLFLRKNGVLTKLNLAFDSSRFMRMSKNSSCSGTWSRYFEFIYKCKISVTENPFDTMLISTCYLNFVVELAKVTTSGSPAFTNLASKFEGRLNICSTNFQGFQTSTVNSRMVSSIYGSVYYNPEIYSTTDDSVFLELTCPIKDFSGNCVTYNTDFAPEYPYPCNCPGGKNNCTPNPKVNPPKGFYFHPVSGDFVFYTAYSSGENFIYNIRIKQFHKNDSSQMNECGFTSAFFIYGHDYQYASPPVFSIPEQLHICESDTVELQINASDQTSLNKLFFEFTGNFTGYSASIDDSIYYKPIANMKLWGKKELVRTQPYVLTVHVQEDTCVFGTETAKSMLIYITEAAKGKVTISKGNCNSVHGNLDSILPDRGMKKITWSIYESTLHSPPVKQFNTSYFELPGLKKQKYYVTCTIEVLNANCAVRTYLDSIDFTQSWPDLEFNLNRSTICDSDTIQSYYPVEIKGFSYPITSWWSGDTFTKKTDTLLMRFDTATKLFLQISDTTGCMFSKEFDLKIDSLSGIKVTSDTLLCGPQSFELGSYNELDGSVWKGHWKVVNGMGDTTDFGSSYTINYPFHAPDNDVYATFVSPYGCSDNFRIKVRVDTTSIRIGRPPDVCGNVGAFELDKIPHQPKHGLWYSEFSQDSVLRVDTFGSYPTTVQVFYRHVSHTTGCAFDDSAAIYVSDTSRYFFSKAGTICKEVKLVSANEIFPQTVPGLWTPGPGLTLINNEFFKPIDQSDGSYLLVYHFSDLVCPGENHCTFTIDTSKIELQGLSDKMGGFAPLQVQFHVENSLGNQDSTHFKWDFGDPAAGAANHSTLRDPIFTYQVEGIYHPVVSARFNGCYDTLSLDSIEVQLSALDDITVSELCVYPNPFEQHIVISNAGNAELYITLLSPSGQSMHALKCGALSDAIMMVDNLAPGIYFLMVESTYGVRTHMKMIHNIH